jgi:hypothetical protein
VMLLGEAHREAPVQAQLRPTCAGPAMSKRQRVEWASLRQPATYLNAFGVTPRQAGSLSYIAIQRVERYLKGNRPRPPPTRDDDTTA